MTCPFVCSSRPHLGSVPDFRFPMADGPAEPYSSGAVLRRPQKGRLAALRDEPSKARPRPSARPEVVCEFFVFLPQRVPHPRVVQGSQYSFSEKNSCLGVQVFLYFCLLNSMCFCIRCCILSTHIH